MSPSKVSKSFISEITNFLNTLSSAIHGFLLRSPLDMQYLCSQQQICDNLEFLTIATCHPEKNMIDLLLRNVLKSMPILSYLSIEVYSPVFIQRCCFKY